MTSIYQHTLKATLAIAALIPSATSASEHPANLATIVPAGERLLATDSNGTLWITEGNSNGKFTWRQATLSLQGAQVRRIVCSFDGSGACALTFTDGSKTSMAYLSPSSREFEVRELEHTFLIGIFPLGRVVYAKASQDGTRQVFSYDPIGRSIAFIGILKPGESGIVTVVNGKIEPIAISPPNSARQLFSTAPLQLANVDFPIQTRFGALYSERWDSRSQYHGGNLTISVGGWTTSGASLQPKMINVSFPHSYPMSPFSDSFTGTANGDIFAIVAGRDGKRIGYLCSDTRGGKLSYGLAAIGQVAADETASLIATGSSSAVYLLSTSPRYGQMLSRLEFTDKATLSTMGGRKCSGNLVKATVLLEGTSPLPADWEVLSGVAQGSGGQSLPYTILRPRNGPIEKVLLDTYGAYGAQRVLTQPAASILSQLALMRTAIVFATVRGDGDYGYAFGMASRSPSRSLAVADISRIAEHIKKTMLSESGKVFVRGHSAGGWLAVRAAIERPDLFSGAISYAGPYYFQGIPKIANGDFFAASDSWDTTENRSLLASRCKGQSITIIHSKADEVVGFDQSIQFRDELTKSGCRVKFTPIDRRGHAMFDFSAPDILDWGREVASSYFQL